jgi:hypothetical protein
MLRHRANLYRGRFLQCTRLPVQDVSSDESAGGDANYAAITLFSDRKALQDLPVFIPRAFGKQVLYRMHEDAVIPTCMV